MDESQLKRFGAALKAARSKQRVKQVELAAAAHVDQSTIWRVESGRGWPLGANLLAIIGAYVEVCGADEATLWHAAGRLAPGEKPVAINFRGLENLKKLDDADRAKVFRLIDELAQRS